MGLSKKALILIIVGVIFSNLVVFFAVSTTYQRKMVQVENQTKNSKENIRIDQIVQELEKETIHSSDKQNAYDQIIEKSDKSFVYDSRGNVIIQNQEVYITDFEVPLDVNQYYQDIIEKFINLYKQYDDIITVDNLILAGFRPEVRGYGIKNMYPDIQQNYKALSRYYMNKRIVLELEIERFINSRSSIEKIENKYYDYSLAKKMLNDYIDGITPGDI